MIFQHSVKAYFSLEVVLLRGGPLEVVLLREGRGGEWRGARGKGKGGGEERKRLRPQ